MVQNLPVRKHEFQGFTIEGYSRAAVQSYFRIPELKALFDLGASPWDFMGTPNVFITHAHLDHLASLPVYVARRRMMKMEPPRVFVPEEIVENVQRLLAVWQKLDRGRMVCELEGVVPGKEIELSREHVVTAFPTKHTVPSVGYCIWERRKKLKPEFVGRPGDELRDLRLSGTEITHETRLPLVCYTGDTAPAGLDADPCVYEAKILITEMTFYRPDHRREKIHKFGHTHLDDILERADRFKNELIVLGHFSTRYHEEQVIRAAEKKLPKGLRERVVLWT